MKNLKIEKIEATFLKTNNYIIESEGNVVLIDASAEASKIKSMIGDKNVLGLFLTHGHWDHFLNLDNIIQEFNIKCYLSKEALIKIKDNKKKYSWNKNVETKLGDDCFVVVKGGKIVRLGNFEILIVESKGHTNCGLCFKMGDNIFTGDTIFKGACGRCDLPTGNEIEIKESLAAILGLDESTKIYPGHMSETAVKNEKNTNYFI